jgi:hypothetical protein
LHEGVIFLTTSTGLLPWHVNGAGRDFTVFLCTLEGLGALETVITGVYGPPKVCTRGSHF